jgi:hypothetical protein
MDNAYAGQFAHFMRTGKAEECIRLAEEILSREPDALLARAYLGIACGATGDREAEIANLAEAAQVARTANDRSVEAFARHYLGLARRNGGAFGAALEELERAQQLGLSDSEFLTALCETARMAGQFEKAREWGAQALQSKDTEFQCPPEDRVAPSHPKPFDPSAKERNVIAYSLFGEGTFYSECAVTSARMAPFVYPEFTARFYCGNTIPDRVLRALAVTGADVRVMTQTASSPFAGLFWRFLPFDDSDVDVVLVRDVDSPLLPRERGAVDAWLAGDRPFHVLRDHVQHNAPMLAGLWGGFTGLLPPLGPAMSKYLAQDTTRFADQRFLRQFVWPRIRQATLAIDSHYSLGETIDFPGLAGPGNVHVGCGWTRRQMEISRDWQSP